jgi:HK97 family phage prohead protease
MPFGECGVIKEKNEGKSFFLTNYVEWVETGLKSGREHYITGFISTDEIDRSKDIVTREAMVDMVAQLKSGNVKLDIEHSTFTGDVDIPVGKIIDAKLVDHEGKSKIWIKAVINKSHSKFNEVWKSIQDGFLDAFSIAYRTKEFAKSIINDTEVTLLKALDLLNVAITGNPVNQGATMTSSFMKSLKANMEVENMAEEEEQQQEEINAGLGNTSPDSVLKVVEEEVHDAQAEEVKVEEVVQEQQKVEEPRVNPLDEIKSLKDLIKQQDDKIAELKAILEKPQLKSVVEETPANKSVEIKINPLDML